MKITYFFLLLQMSQIPKVMFKRLCLMPHCFFYIWVPWNSPIFFQKAFLVLFAWVAVPSDRSLSLTKVQSLVHPLQEIFYMLK